MPTRPQCRTMLLAVAVCVAAQWAAVSAQPAVKRPLGYDAVDYWRSIQGTRLSDDGQWLAYALTAPGDDGELVVRNLRTGQEFRHPRGASPAFTPDGRFVVFSIAQLKADEEKEARANAAAGAETASGETPQRGRSIARRREPKTGLGIMALPGGGVKTFEKVGGFKLPEKSSTWVAYYKGTQPAEATQGARGAGAGQGARGTGRGAGGAPGARSAETAADLIVRNLVSGEEVTIPDVTEYTWDSKGTWIAYAVSSSDGAKDGAYARRAADGAATPLLTGRGHYRSLVFAETGGGLAFLSDQANHAQRISPYRLYYAKSPDAAAVELVSESTAGMPSGRVVSEFAAPQFSKDGTRLYLGTGRPPDPAPDAQEKARTPVKVDIWNYKDPLLQPMQKVREEQERERSYRAVVHLADRRFVQLATDELPVVNAADTSQAIGTSDLAYRQELSWDRDYNDVFLLDQQNGKSKKVLDHWGAALTSLSPEGRYLLYFDDRAGHWYSYRVSDGARTNLTAKIAASFQMQERDTPDLPGPYGSAGWTSEDRSVLLYDKYDIWEVKPDGTGAHMITAGQGREKQIVFRYRAVDPEERAVPSTRPLLLSATDERSRATGFYRIAKLGTTASPEKLVMIDKAFGPVTKARDSGTVVFTLSRFDEFPDLWVSDTTFHDMKKVSNANPQQANYAWGTSELIDYVNADGRKLRAILTKPDNFDPSKKYPLMVYIYEELTQGLHTYTAPNVGTSINLARYVSNGYVLLRPDIVYETGYPGQSAEKCVVPAVETVLAMGFIDPKRIGIQGHSWGGYQITYLVTRTNLFAAVEAGAAVSDMISAYGGIRWGTGMSRAFQYEKSQSRIGAPPWDAPLQFIENSPIFWVRKVQTPYLTIANDEDDAVPWYQGIEFFTAMRRLGKEAYMFSFNGEKHSLRNRDNQKYWTVHMDEFFDHFLLGRPRPAWMDNVVPYTERGTRDVAPLFKRTPAAVTTSQQER